MKIKFSSKTFPLVLVILCTATFGLLIPYLGYYVDDWHHIYYGYSRGIESLWELFLYDNRPFASIVYTLGFSILDFRPVSWQFASLLIRSITVLFVWFTLCEIWPHNKREVSWVTLLFAIYPLFSLQAVSVAYFLHWIGYLLYVVSIWAMVRSIRLRSYYWLYTLLSIITGGINLLLLEYFSGLELIRPVIIWLLISENNVLVKRELKSVLKLWLPYLLMLINFVIFRIFFFPQPATGVDRNAPTLLLDLVRSPTPTIIYISQNILKDVVIILGSTWSKIIDPQLFSISLPVNLAAIFLAVLCIALLYVYLTNLVFNHGEKEERNREWEQEALFIGLLLTLLGPLPAWSANLFISTENPLWSTRLGLPAMLGASLVVIALLNIFIENRKCLIMVLCLIIGFSSSWHIVNTNEYRNSWIKQTDFFHQLYLRAPYIEPGTTFLSDGEIFSHMTEISTSFAISTMYPKLDNMRALNYFFFSLYRRFNDLRKEMIEGMPLSYARYYTKYQGDSHNSLVIYYAPEQNQCLWVLDPKDEKNPLLPEITSEMTVISNLDRIKPDSPYITPLPAEIFGRRGEDHWCTYFQKGDLARQNQDWVEVVSQWNTAMEGAHKPANGVEYLPFIEGFAHVGDWETASDLTRQANRITRKMRPILCSTWERIATDTQAAISKDDVVSEITSDLACP